MAVQTIYLTGEGKWCRVHESQMDTKFGEKFNMMFKPDEASKIVLKASGSRVKPHEEEDGTWYRFSRDNKKEFKGELTTLGPPKVIDAENKPLSAIIGNGSKLTVKLEIYDSKYGKGTRLEAIRVDELVPYKNGENAGEYPF